MRPLIERVTSLIDESQAPQIFVIEAPTGYGKSVSGPVFYERFYNKGWVESFIHVLPLRAIVRDIYMCTLVCSLSSRCPDVCRKSPPMEVSEALNKIKISIDEIAYQMGELILGENEQYRKEPLFDARYVVTTLDSFIYNLFRVPVTEIIRKKKHYAIPRLRIFISTVYFDEAHMVFEDDSEISTIFTSTMRALKVLMAFKVPTILTSATLGRNLLDLLLNEMRGELKSPMTIVRLGEKEREYSLTGGDAKMVEVPDRDFVDKIVNVKWSTQLIRDEDVAAKARELLEGGCKVLIVRDSVKRAIETYRGLRENLGEDNIVLIHGLLTRCDRERALKSMKESIGAEIVVATSVIEAGVDVSFDSAITDGSRIRSVVQRAGRVCRYGECNEAYIYLVKEYSDKSLVDFINKHGQICWRLPFNAGKYRGYGELVDALGTPHIDYELDRLVSAIIDPLFVSGTTINDVLREVGYVLTRIGLVECLVGDYEEVKAWSYGDLVSHGLVVSVPVAEKLLLRDCIVGVIAVHDDHSVETVCGVNELVTGKGDSLRFSYLRYVTCLRKAYEKSRDVLHVALLVKKNCYDKGIGLKVYDSM